MPKDLLLVELYAGLASLSLFFAGGKPPLGRRGSKTAYAPALAKELFGGTRPDRFLLNDADAGVANALSMLVDPKTRREVAARIEETAAISKPAYALWRDLAAASRLDDPPREAARWLILSAGSSQGELNDGCEMQPYRIDPPANCSRATQFCPRLTSLAERVRAFPLDASICSVRHGPAETLDPIPGAVVYLDPPYRGTKGYASVSLLPPRVLCERWARAGCKVGLSETLASQAPLGWPCVDLSAINSGRQMIRAGRRELLFVSP